MDNILDNLIRTKQLVNDTLSRLEGDIEQKAIYDEYRIYEYEGEEEFRDRFNDSDAWKVIERDDMGQLEYSNLCTGNDCWYKGNSDRLEGCIIQRMAGTDDLILCDMCIDKTRELNDYIERNIDRFMKNDKFKRKTERLLNSLGSNITVKPLRNTDVLINGDKTVKEDEWQRIMEILPKIGYEIDDTVYHIKKKSKK
jgi:hypothetical protein